MINFALWSRVCHMLVVSVPVICWVCHALCFWQLCQCVAHCACGKCVHVLLTDTSLMPAGEGCFLNWIGRKHHLKSWTNSTNSMKIKVLIMSHKQVVVPQNSMWKALSECVLSNNRHKLKCVFELSQHRVKKTGKTALKCCAELAFNCLNFWVFKLKCVWHAGCVQIWHNLKVHVQIWPFSQHQKVVFWFPSPLCACSIFSQLCTQITLCLHPNTENLRRPFVASLHRPRARFHVHFVNQDLTWQMQVHRCPAAPVLLEDWLHCFWCNDCQWCVGIDLWCHFASLCASSHKAGSGGVCDIRTSTMAHAGKLWVSSSHDLRYPHLTGIMWNLSLHTHLHKTCTSSLHLQLAFTAPDFDKWHWKSKTNNGLLVF